MKMESKEAYIKRLEVQLEEWNNEMERLRINADKATTEAQAEYDKQLDELNGKQEDLRAYLAELNKANNDAWRDVKEGADNAWRELDAAFRRAVTRFS